MKKILLFLTITLFTQTNTNAVINDDAIFNTTEVMKRVGSKIPVTFSDAIVALNGNSALS